MKYIALLRGINVGGHHKVSMAELRKEFVSLGYDNIITILNSGNVIFESRAVTEKKLEEVISEHLEKVFGFHTPVLIRNAESISELVKNKPFREIEVTKDIRCYISFLKEKTASGITLPWSSVDGSFQILEIRDKAVVSVLDLAHSQTIKAMEILEQFFGKSITTRNWNTILRIAGKC